MPRKRKRRSWGSITTVNRRKHIIRWTQDTPEGRTRLSKTLYCTYREADAELARIHAYLGSGGPSKTVGYAHDAWWWPDMQRKSAEKGKPKERTLNLYARTWSRFVRPRWEGVPLDKVRRLDVQEWLRGISEGDGKVALVVLRGVLDAAVKYEEVEANNLRGVDFDLGPKSRARDRSVYSLAEAEEMWGKLRGTQVEAPYLLACFGGARTGESLGARCREAYPVEVYGERMAVVPIMRQMGRTGCAPTADGDLKNPQSVRSAIIPAPYGDRVLEIASENLARGSGWLADRGDGLPMNKATLDRAWTQTAGDMAIPFANLRASWRTFARYEWGLPNDTTELLMGHLLPGVTGQHYLRPSVDDLARDVAEAMAAYRAKLG